MITQGKAVRSALLVGAVLAALAALAQADTEVDDLAAEYTGGGWVLKGLALTLVWFAVYLAFYAAAVIITLATLRLFSEVDADLIIAVSLIWGGGVVLSGIAFVLAGAIEHKHMLEATRWLGLAFAIPLNFLWAWLIATRRWLDLTWRDAAVVALVVALACAPYAGTPFRFAPRRAPDLGQIQPAQPRPAEGLTGLVE